MGVGHCDFNDTYAIKIYIVNFYSFGLPRRYTLGLIRSVHSSKHTD